MSKREDKKTKSAKKKKALIYQSKKILEASIDGFCVISLDGRLLNVNPAVCDITGYSKEELLKMRIEDLEVDETAEQTKQHAEKVLQIGYDRFERKHRRKDGKIINVEVSTQVYDSEQGKFFFSFFRDITDRKQAEEALRESEERLLLAMSAADMGTWRWNPETNQDTRDASFNRILGLEAKESTQSVEDFFQRVHPHDRKMVKQKVQRALRDHQTYLSEFRIIHPDGAVRWLRDRGELLFGENDQVLYMTGAVMDITEHKENEEALRESEERYKTLFQNAAEGVIVADLETKKFKYANPAICKMLGYTEKELLQLGVNDIHPGENLPHVFSEFEAQARGEKTLAPELPCLRKDGTVIYADVNAASVMIDGRKCNVGFFTDITERKQAEEEIRKFRTIAEKANYGVAISDIDGNLIYVNEYFAAIHGYTTEQLIGKNLVVFHNKEQLKEVLRLNENLKKLGSLNATETWHTHKCGTVFPMLMSSIIIKDENGEPRYMATTAIDITEKKRLESEYEKYKEKILSVQKHIYVSTLSSIVAHQINQPLTKISILLDRALEALNNTTGKPCCPDVAENVKEGLAEARNIDSIIRKFREHSKNPAQQSSAKSDVNAVADRIISTLSERASQAKMLVTTKNLDNLPEIEINEIALEQIFLIIIQNAIEAADGKKRHKLDISGKLVDDNIELRFIDDCCGIAPENVGRIFEPFFSTKTENGGLGLGLDILQQLLINCGGQAQVKSQLGKGTTFYVTLPIRAVTQ